MKFALAFILLSGCATDKILHAGVGAGLGVTSPEHGCAMSIAAGIAKEAYDSTGRGTVDPMDAITTGLSGCVVAWLIREMQ